MRLDHVARELVCKVVYCGPGLSGKTTNLHHIHTQAPKQSVGEMVNIDTESERTLHFDLLPLDLGNIQGYRCRFEFYTVPGQSYYAATRRLVIEGADGIVFVVDSRRDAMDENIESMNDLHDNLRHHNLPDSTPIIIQYNKQDLPDALPPEQLNPLLNHQNHPYFTACATQGDGVMETMKKITTSVISRVKELENLESAAEQPAAPSPEPTPSPATPPPPPPPTHATPPPAAPAEPETWLLTCYHCQSILEVPHASKGDIFQCGSCQAPLEVEDPDHGSTRRPQPVLSASSIQKRPPDISPTGPLPAHGTTPLPDPTQTTPPPPPPPPSNPAAPPPPATDIGLPQLTPRGQSVAPSTGTQALPDPSGTAALPPGDDTGYGMQAVGDTSRAALTPVDTADLTPGSGTQVLLEQFPIQGMTPISPLDTSLLGTRFRVKDNASGVVYRALVLSQTILRQPTYLDNLEPNLQMAARVEHPNIVKLHGLRRAHVHNVAIYADLPNYQPLTLLLARREKLQPPQAMHILRQLAEGLEAAARQGVIHGWVRPDVVLVSSDGKVLLDELGIPKLHSYLLHESLGASAATEHYLAPEHLVNDAPSDIRTDMFQLGALAFHMISGEGLVTGYSAHEALHKVSAAGCRTLRDCDPHVSRELSRFVAKLTSIDRKDRFQNYRELIDAMARFGDKRGTFKLTQTVPASPQAQARARNRNTARHGGTGRTNRAGRSTGTGPIPRSGGKRTTAHNNRPGRGTGTGTRPGRTTGQGNRAPEEAPRRTNSKSSNGGGATGLIILILIAAAIGVGGWYYYKEQQRELARKKLQEQENKAQAPDHRQPKPNNATKPDEQQTTATTREKPNLLPTLTDKKSGEDKDAQSKPDKHATTDTTQTTQSTKTTTPNNADTDPLAKATSLVEQFEANPQDAALQQKASDAVRELRLANPSASAALWARLTHAIPVSDSAQRRQQDIMVRLDKFLTEERFQNAFELLPRLSDTNVQAEAKQRIIKQQSEARNALQRQIWEKTTIAEAKAALRVAYDIWNTPEDREWADVTLEAFSLKLQDKTRVMDPSNLESGTKVTNGGAGAGAHDQDMGPLFLTRADRDLDQALRTSQTSDIDRILGRLKGKSAEEESLRHKVWLWNQKDRILTTAMKDRPMKLRVTAPIRPGEWWDVQTATSEHLVIKHPAGETMNLKWAEVKAPEIGPLFTHLAGDGAKPVDFALASVANLLSGKDGLANLQMRRAKSLKYERSVALETSISLFKNRPVIDLLDQARAAANKHDPDGLQAAVNGLRKADVPEAFGLQPHLQKLEQQLARMSSGRDATTGRKLKDKLLFDQISDRDAFPQRTGSWIIGGGQLRNDGDATLSREDCGNAASVSVAFTIAARNGVFSTSFRGVRMLIDFGRQTYQIDSGDQRIAPESFPFLEQTRYLLHMTFNKTNGQMRIELNQAKSIDIRTGGLASGLKISVDTGAVVAFDSIEIKRLGDDNKAVQEDADLAKQQAFLRDVLGLTPIGRAHKDPGSQAIILPKLPKGKSGIGFALRDDLKGMSFTIAGQGPKSNPGKLIVGLGSVEPKRTVGQFRQVDLPALGAPPLKVQVRWTEKKYEIIFRQQGMDDMVLEDDRRPDARQVIIQTDSDARILSTPEAIRQ